MLETKLDYIHKNPCNGKWNLAGSYVEYGHSSIHFYENPKYGFEIHYKDFY